jgi:hypothetical protein
MKKEMKSFKELVGLKIVSVVIHEDLIYIATERNIYVAQPDHTLEEVVFKV